LDPAIRYVAIIDKSNTLVECKGQGTFFLLLSLETWVDFVSIGPLLTLGSMGNKLESSCGRLGYVIGRFKKALVIIYQLRSFMVVAVMDAIVQVQQLEKIAAFLKKVDEGEIRQVPT